MNKSQKFIETKEYKRFAEFCDACIKYKYIGICYGLPGVGKTLSSRYYSNWDYIEKQIDYKYKKKIGWTIPSEVGKRKFRQTFPSQKNEIKSAGTNAFK